jgi:hypothetical protein
MIDAAQVFVGILTRRHPIYDLSETWRSAFRIVTHNLLATKWTAPAWVIQEAGYAQRAGLKLILFREQGVEIPGLQGDLEYIEFTTTDYAPAFQRANEMIHRQIGKESGILVETTVNTVAPEGDSKDPSSEPAEAKEGTAFHPDVLFIQRLYDATYEKRFDEAALIFRAEAERLEQEKPDGSVWLEAFYCQWRFEAGDEGALSELRALAARKPQNWRPRACVAKCLNDFNDFIAAGGAYLEAADRSTGERSVEYTIAAARAFRRGKEFLEAKDILLPLTVDERDEAREKRGEVLKELYETFKNSNERFHAVAIGELALYENPALADFRFELAHDCDDWNYVDTSIHHYAVLCEKQPDNAAAIQNLGVAYSRRALDISSVDAYNRAIELGETLGARNLGLKYLSGGMASDAATLVERAMETASPDPGLPEVLTAIEEKRKGESEKNSNWQTRHRNIGISPSIFPLGCSSPWLAIPSCSAFFLRNRICCWRFLCS